MMHDLDDLVSNADIAEMLGVHQPTVIAWRNRDLGFPEPLTWVSPSRVPLYSRQAVLDWAAATGRLPADLVL